MIYFFVYEQKAAMSLVELFYLDKRILSVAAVNIQLELIVDTLCVDSGRHLFPFFIKQGDYGVIHIVVNKHNKVFRFSCQI